MTLLEKAKQTERSRTSHDRCGTHEHAELALAWLNEQVTDAQVIAALKPAMKRASNGRYLIATIVKACVNTGTLKVSLGDGKGSE